MRYNNGDDSQKSIEFMYQQKLLLAENIVYIQFLVPFPWLDTKLHQQLKNLSLVLNNSWHQYEFGWYLNFMKTNESGIHHFDWTCWKTTNCSSKWCWRYQRPNKSKHLKKTIWDTTLQENKNEDQIRLHLQSVLVQALLAHWWIFWVMRRNRSKQRRHWFCFSWKRRK